MNSRWLVIGFGAVLTGVLIAGQTWGQPDADGVPQTTTGVTGIGTINYSRIYVECAQVKDLTEIIQKKEMEVQTEVRERQKVLEEKRAALTAFRIGTPDYDARNNEMMRLAIDSNVWIKMEEQNLELQKFQWTRILYEQAQAAIEAISKERGLSMVLQIREYRPDELNFDVALMRRFIQERNVAYAGGAVDITSEVIARLDAEYRAAGGKKILSPSVAPAASGPRP